MKLAILTFPGSHCARDLSKALSGWEGVEVQSVWHSAVVDLLDYDALFFPGGFSYGDILRAGAIASFSPLLEQVRHYADQKRGLILGICNGFQILTEARLLLGVLHQNQQAEFICREQAVQVLYHRSPFTCLFQENEIIQLPIAHHQGCYVADEKLLFELKKNHQIAFSYIGNPNGSVEDIAGVFSPDHRILGLMPHPERNALGWMGSQDGARLLESMICSIHNEKKIDVDMRNEKP